MKSLRHCILLVIFLVLSSYPGYCLEADNIIVHFNQVGYGDAILIELPNDKKIMIDTGTEDYSKNLKEYIKDLNISSLDAVIITHPHDNHFGGLSRLVDDFDIKAVYINGDERTVDEGYFPLFKKIKSKGIPVHTLREGDYLDLGLQGAELLILHPGELSRGTNDESIVSWLRFKNTSFLFTADIQEDQQRRIIRRYPDIRKSNCIQVPHHGGNIDSEFASYFTGRLLVVSTGRNKYRKPRKRHLKKFRTEVYRTDRDGPVVLESNGEKVWIRQ